MHDIKWIRDNPAAFDAGLARRKLGPLAEQVLEQDAALRALKTQLQDWQGQRNSKSKEIGAAKAKGEDADAIIAAVGALKENIKQGEEDEKAQSDALDAVLAGLPNLLDDDIPDGADEDDNVEIAKIGEPRLYNFEPKEHFELGEATGMMDFDAAAKISGARFVVLRGQLARLSRALGAFMLDLHTDTNGYEEVQPPLLVRDEAAFGTGQLPKFTEDLFRTTNDMWLIPTAEISLTNLVRQQILNEADLPIRMTALTPCFRSEAGSAGKDTRGMIRQHQFDKVELVSITTEDDSDTELERLRGCAEAVLKALELPYRVMVLASGDTGFSARRTYDLEVWLPGQGRYREISSCSNTGPFQARRMGARYRVEGEKQIKFVHTLNGSGLAVGRALIAVMENYQQEDGTITVPKVLLPYMGGLEVIG
jgi:seryl-tRNA synthetase